MADYGDLGFFIRDEIPYSSVTKLPDALERGVPEIEFDGIAAKFGANVIVEGVPAGTLDKLALTDEEKPLALRWSFEGAEGLKELQVTKAIKIEYTWRVPDHVDLTPEQLEKYPDRQVTTFILVGYVGPNQ